MNQILKELRFMLSILQWILFLLFFYLYMNAHPRHDPLFFLLLVLMIAHAAFLWYALPRRSWLLLGLVDLGVAVYFIVLTGKWNSPFMLYAYSTLLWLTTVLRLKPFLLVAALFLLTYSVLQAWVPYEMHLPPSHLDDLRFLLDILLWTSMSYWIFTAINLVKGAYSKGLQIYLFMRRLSHSEQHAHLCQETEKTVRRLFRTDHAYLCLFEEREGEGNWRRDYFVQRLLDLGAEGWGQVTSIVLFDFTGREDTYICWPLRQNGQSWGCLLFSIPTKKPISRYEKLLLRMMDVYICQRLKQNWLREEKARALHVEMRRKLAQDMHDGLAQQLFLLSAQLFQIKQTLPAGDKGPLLKRLRQMEERIQWCHGEVRHYITHLRDARPHQKIAEALEQLLQRITADKEIQVAFSKRGRFGEEPLPIQDAIYRLVEEAAVNVVKHAGATRLEVSVEASALQICVRVKDNGIGFVPDEKSRLPNHYGLLGMKERIAEVGGTLQISSCPEQGTEIVAIVPKKGVERYG
ncbi:sensor histidine kinase [Brevibacillus composti]|uniref:histidine kinase n=1 Tax=Brevibacillus composti TaxID=2796470 RepID=A0A7T5ELL9_9BACL|nr:sensor histidine kinase [Brevibacillus composti]QQE74825.1 sensor histidine kinase [Brevibacillus composti]QUO41909.1 sensor histidine kinase [Brevibacillus composti]